MSEMLDEHLGYLADPVRLEAYRRAIQQSVKRGDIVADLGCGTGILGLLCLEAGAGHVYGIDDTGIIDVAREAMVRAGHENRFTFIRGQTTEIELPEPVDLLICDHIGYMGVDYGVLELLQDAKRRFLKPGGRLIPQAIGLYLAGVDSDTCRKQVDAWSQQPVPAEYHWLRERCVQATHAVDLKREDLTSDPQRLAELDLGADHPDFFSWQAEMRINRSGTMDGVALWFDCDLADGVRMTNSPCQEDAIRRSQTFLPIERSIEVVEGEAVSVKVMARPSENMFAWTLRFASSGKRFAQSTLGSMPLSSAALRRADPAHVPALRPESTARSLVLGYCDGNRTVEQIMQCMLDNHPDILPTEAALKNLVWRVLRRDTR